MHTHGISIALEKLPVKHHRATTREYCVVAWAPHAGVVNLISPPTAYRNSLGGVPFAYELVADSSFLESFVVLASVPAPLALEVGLGMLGRFSVWSLLPNCFGSQVKV